MDRIDRAVSRRRFLGQTGGAALVEDREPAINIYEALAMTAPGIVAHQSALAGGQQLKVPSSDA